MICCICHEHNHDTFQPCDRGLWLSQFLQKRFYTIDSRAKVKKTQNICFQDLWNIINVYLPTYLPTLQIEQGSSSHSWYQRASWRCSCTSLFRNPSLSADGTWTANYWPLHTPVKREVLELNANYSRVLEGHRVKKCAFWKKFLPRLLALSKF